ncbi:uncharacterized protein PG998_005128 [Apiospora kogelbergensis]|uniref:uncharacterized protein n=1 Tax=Apiospora kogelbergensis TaxID=1337665 RepID=UPI003130BD2E
MGHRAYNSHREGDEVWLLAGADTPIVLKRQGEAGIFRIVAPAFISDAMGGELWPDGEKS